MEIRRRPPNPKVKVAHLEYAIPHPEEAPRHILEQIVWEKDREVTSARERLPPGGLGLKAPQVGRTGVEGERGRLEGLAARRIGGRKRVHDYLSTSPNTRSSEPMIDTASASMCRCASTSIACRCAKPGGCQPKAS